MLVPTIQQFHPDQPQTSLEDGGRTRADVSEIQFQPKRPFRLVPGKQVVDTRSECSLVAWYRLIVHQPPSYAHVAQTLAISYELKQMSRDQLAALARTAKGSMKTSGENAAAIVRRLRDEWDDSD